MFKSALVCTLVFLVNDLHGIKQCRDCVRFDYCQKAMELAETSRNADTENKFKQSFCGKDSSGYRAVPKVCCSDFDHASNLENHRNARLLPDSCGDIDGKRIIGGRRATLYEYPWMVLISYQTRIGLQFQCGGSIINSRYVLTAAHCVKNKNIAGVRIGENDIRYPTDCQGEGQQYVCESHVQDILVEEKIIHREFEHFPSIVNDIALLRLKKPINLSYRNAGPICLPLTSSMRGVPLSGRTATVAGWGLTENNEESSVLLKVEVPILSNSECRVANSGESSQKEFCAGTVNRDSCDGDSGGPLMLESMYNNAPRIIQYGIVSRGPKMCGSHQPGIYTDVTKYMDWILDNIRE